MLGSPPIVTPATGMERTTWDQDTRPGESRHDECLTPSAPYKLFALAYNLANFLRTLALPDEVAHNADIRIMPASAL